MGRSIFRPLGDCVWARTQLHRIRESIECTGLADACDPSSLVGNPVEHIGRYWSRETPARTRSCQLRARRRCRETSHRTISSLVRHGRVARTERKVDARNESCRSSSTNLVRGDEPQRHVGLADFSTVAREVQAPGQYGKWPCIDDPEAICDGRNVHMEGLRWDSRVMANRVARPCQASILSRLCFRAWSRTIFKRSLVLS